MKKIKREKSEEMEQEKMFFINELQYDILTLAQFPEIYSPVVTKQATTRKGRLDGTKTGKYKQNTDY